MSDILAPIWDSPPTSSEDWKKDEKDLTLSLGGPGIFKTIYSKLLTSGKHQPGMMKASPRVLTARRGNISPSHCAPCPETIFYGLLHSGCLLRATATYSPRWTADHQVLPEWRTEGALQGSLLRRPCSSTLPLRSPMEEWRAPGLESARSYLGIFGEFLIPLILFSHL